jgi:crotonobetainyl-CoA:carnitine CoA-transferase CaiB-like acyl-CoA transferase
VIELLEGAFAGHPTAELLPRLAELGVPSGRVRTLDEVYGWDQTRSQGLLVDVEHATLGSLQLPGPPLRFFDPGPNGETETTRREHAAPPVLGADGDAIRAWLSGGDAVPQPDGDDVEDGHAT